MISITRWTTVFALGAVAGTGMYFYQTAENPESAPSQEFVRSDAALASTGEHPPGTAPQLAAAPATNPVNPAGANATSDLSASIPTPEQQRSFDTLRHRLHDLSIRRTHTYREFLAMSLAEYDSLTEDMKHRLVAEMDGMIERGELSLEQFVPEPMAPATVAVAPPPPSSPPPTAAQWQTYDNIKRNLHDPAFTQSRTLAQLAALPELKTLPPALQQELTNEALEMLRNGTLVLRPPENRATSNRQE